MHRTFFDDNDAAPLPSRIESYRRVGTSPRNPA